MILNYISYDHSDTCGHIFEITLSYRTDFLTVKKFQIKFSNNHNFKFQLSKTKKKSLKDFVYDVTQKI